MQLKNTYSANQAYNYPLLIKQLFITAKSHDDKQEIVFRNQKRIQYGEFFKRIERLGNVLKNLRLEPNQTIAMMDWDSHRYLECFFAVPMSQMILQTVNIRLSNDQIIYVLNHAKADILLINSDFWDVYQKIKPSLSTVKKVIWLTDDNQAKPNECIGEYEELLNSVSSKCYFPDFDENTRATTFYTTGTTGLPKGVYFSHRQLVLHTLSVTAALGTSFMQGRLHREDVYMPMTPMFHVHAWGLPYIATMLGIKQVYPGRYLAKELLNLIQQEKVTFTHCVPTILQMLLDDEDSHKVDLSQLKMIIGGSSLSDSLAKRAIQRGVDVFTGYGMSETCPVLTLAQLSSADLEQDIDDAVEMRTRTGKSIPLVSIEIIDENMRTLPHNKKYTGEIIVRAPWLTQGYLYDKESSDDLWQGGWLHTKDVGYISPDNWLQVTDRLKDVIKSGGEWVSSLAIENIIAHHEAVRDVAVIGVEHAKWGERPVALVALNDEFKDNITGNDIKAIVQDAIDQGKIGPYGMPDSIIVCDELPKTSVGKINKKLIRERYLEEVK